MMFMICKNFEYILWGVYVSLLTHLDSNVYLIWWHVFKMSYAPNFVSQFSSQTDFDETWQMWEKLDFD